MGDGRHDNDNDDSGLVAYKCENGESDASDQNYGIGTTGCSCTDTEMKRGGRNGWLGRALCASSAQPWNEATRQAER